MNKTKIAKGIFEWFEDRFVIKVRGVAKEEWF